MSAGPTYATNSTSALTFNSASTFYPTNAYFQNETVTTITYEQPVVTTNSIYNVSVTTDYEADRSQVYMLRPKLDAWHDDNVNFSVDKNGLLYSLATSNMDQSGAVIVTIAQTVAQAFELAAGLPGGPSSGPSIETVKGEDSRAPDPTFKIDEDDNFPEMAERLRDIHRVLGLRLQKGKLQELELNIQAFRTSTNPPAARRNALASNVVSALNYIIANDQPTIGDFQWAGIALRPQTLRLVGFIDSVGSEKVPNLRRVLTRMLLDDAFPSDLEPLQYEVPSIPMLLPKTPPQSVDVSFDPYNTSDRDRACCILKPTGLRFMIVTNESSSESTGTYQSFPGTDRAGGIFYRVGFPLTIMVQDQLGNTVSTNIPLPNTSPAFHLNFGKSPLVARVTQVQMTNGCINSYAVTKPSSALAYAQVPLSVVGAIESEITNFIQLRFNFANEQSALNQQNLANQRLAISNALLQQQITQLEISNTAAAEALPTNINSRFLPR